MLRQFKFKDRKQVSEEDMLVRSIWALTKDKGKRVTWGYHRNSPLVLLIHQLHFKELCHLPSPNTCIPFLPLVRLQQQVVNEEGKLYTIENPKAWIVHPLPPSLTLISQPIFMTWQGEVRRPRNRRTRCRDWAPPMGAHGVVGKGSPSQRSLRKVGSGWQKTCFHVPVSSPEEFAPGRRCQLWVWIPLGLNDPPNLFHQS